MSYRYQNYSQFVYINSLIKISSYLFAVNIFFFAVFFFPFLHCLLQIALSVLAPLPLDSFVNYQDSFFHEIIKLLATVS